MHTPKKKLGCIGITQRDRDRLHGAIAESNAKVN